jgi:transcriptional regulator GlxA family with amidase domain
VDRGDRYRIDLATELIGTSDRPLAAIARDVGYSDAFSLSTAYRRVTGVTPQAHRQSRRRGNSSPDGDTP